MKPHNESISYWRQHIRVCLMNNDSQDANLALEHCLIIHRAVCGASAGGHYQGEKYWRVNKDILRPGIIGWCQTTLRGRLEGTAIRIPWNIASLVIDHSFDQVGEFDVNRKKGTIMSKLKEKTLSATIYQCLETKGPDCQYRATTAHLGSD